MGMFTENGIDTTSDTSARYKEPSPGTYEFVIAKAVHVKSQKNKSKKFLIQEFLITNSEGAGANPVGSRVAYVRETTNPDSVKRVVKDFGKFLSALEGRELTGVECDNFVTAIENGNPFEGLRVRCTVTEKAGNGVYANRMFCNPTYSHIAGQNADTIAAAKKQLY